MTTKAWENIDQINTNITLGLPGVDGADGKNGEDGYQPSPSSLVTPYTTYKTIDSYRAIVQKSTTPPTQNEEHHFENLKLTHGLYIDYAKMNLSNDNNLFIYPEANSNGYGSRCMTFYESLRIEKFPILASLEHKGASSSSPYADFKLFDIGYYNDSNTWMDINMAVKIDSYYRPMVYTSDDSDNPNVNGFAQVLGYKYKPGTTNGTYNLETIGGDGWDNIWYDYDEWGNVAGGPYYYQGNLFYRDNIGLYNYGSMMYKNYLFTASDIRIKENFVEIDDNSSLEKIRNIWIGKFNMKEHPSTTLIGFKAQQVATVIPEAVKTNEVNYIPNILKVLPYTYDQSTNILTINSELLDVSLNDNIKLLTNQGEDVLTKLIELNNDISLCKLQLVDEEEISSFNKYYTNLEEDSNLKSNIFVYGKRVNDFHSLDENKVFAVGLSALQEVDRIQQTNVEKIQNLKNTIEQEDPILNDLLARVQALESA